MYTCDDVHLWLTVGELSKTVSLAINSAFSWQSALQPYLQQMKN